VDTLKAEQSALKQLAAALADLDQQGLAAKVEAAAAARDAAAAALEAAEHGVEAANRELAGERHVACCGVQISLSCWHDCWQFNTCC
jgi:hypothetical protein